MFDVNAEGLLVDEMGMPATHSSARGIMEAAQKNRELSPFELIAVAQKVIHPSMREQVDFSFYAAEAESPLPLPHPASAHLREALRSCIPPEEGYYFATWKPTKFREQPFRVVVRIGKDGFGHTRAFMTRASRGYNPSRSRRAVGAWKPQCARCSLKQRTIEELISGHINVEVD